jgi:hypothetical protein
LAFYNSKNNPEWAEEQKAQLGEKGFLQEILRVFLGSGDTYIPGRELARLDEEVKNNYPKRKLFSKYQNRNKNDDPEMNDENKGALWIWKEPIANKEYYFGIDCSEGVGADNSCIQVFDIEAKEQVSEFYSNNITPYEFAQVIYELAILYNNALLIIEEMSAGLSVINTLQNELYYDNFHYNNPDSKNARIGIKTTSANRPLILTSFQTAILQKSIKINSFRLLQEMNCFEYNNTTKRPEAQKGKHDDAIMALSMCLYVMNMQNKHQPAGFDNKKISSIVILDDIKNEIRENIKNNIKMKFSRPNEDLEQKELISIYRPKHSMLKEFGW